MGLPICAILSVQVKNSPKKKVTSEEQNDVGHARIWRWILILPAVYYWWTQKVIASGK